MTDSSHSDSSHSGVGPSSPVSAGQRHSESEFLGSELSPSGPSDSTASGDVDALLSFLQVIEDQDLAQRAPAFVQVYEKLRSALEAADTSV